MRYRNRRPDGSYRDLSRLRLGPRQIRGHTVVLRPPHFADFDAWRRIRLRDRAYIEPFWVSSDLDWDLRHTEKRWVRECLIQRHVGRAGRGISLVIEVDGNFAGQTSIGDIDYRAGTGELGAWVDAIFAGHGVGAFATAMVLDFGFEELGLDRITAPICVENKAALASARRGGLICEAVMSEYFEVGGRRKDHGLWAAVREEVDPEGFSGRWLRSSCPPSDPDLSRAAPALPPAPRSGMVPRTRPALAAVARFYLGTLWRVWTPQPADASLPLRTTTGPALKLRRTILRPPWPRPRRRFPGSRNCLPLTAELDGSIVGECGLNAIDRYKSSAELVLWVTHDHHDVALAEHAAGLLVDHGFGEVGLHRISAVCDVGDEVAAGVLATAGLVREGTMRQHVDAHGRRGDHELWAVTSTAHRRRTGSRSD